MACESPIMSHNMYILKCFMKLTQKFKVINRIISSFLCDGGFLSLQRRESIIIPYSALLVMNYSIAGVMGGIGFYPTPWPLLNFQSMGFSPFYSSVSPLSPPNSICLFFFFFLSEKKLRLLNFFLGFFLLGSLCWRHFRSLNKLWELVLFYIMEPFQDS